MDAIRMRTTALPSSLISSLLTGREHSRYCRVSYNDHLLWDSPSVVVRLRVFSGMSLEKEAKTSRQCAEKHPLRKRLMDEIFIALIFGPLPRTERRLPRDYCCCLFFKTIRKISDDWPVVRSEWERAEGVPAPDNAAPSKLPPLGRKRERSAWSSRGYYITGLLPSSTKVVWRLEWTTRMERREEKRDRDVPIIGDFLERNDEKLADSRGEEEEGMVSAPWRQARNALCERERGEARRKKKRVKIEVWVASRLTYQWDWESKLSLVLDDRGACQKQCNEWDDILWQ